MACYYTGPTVGCYRASIAGDELIIESTRQIMADDIETAKRSFGLQGMILSVIADSYDQPNGKMTKIDE